MKEKAKKMGGTEVILADSEKSKPRRQANGVRSRLLLILQLCLQYVDCFTSCIESVSSSQGPKMFALTYWHFINGVICSALFKLHSRN